MSITEEHVKRGEECERLASACIAESNGALLLYMAEEEAAAPKRQQRRPCGPLALRTVMDVLFLLIAIGCVLLAPISAFATLGLSPTAEKIADKVIYGSCAAALMSVLLAALFLWVYESPLRANQRTIAL